MNPFPQPKRLQLRVPLPRSEEGGEKTNVPVHEHPLKPKLLYSLGSFPVRLPLIVCVNPPWPSGVVETDPFRGVLRQS